MRPVVVFLAALILTACESVPAPIDVQTVCLPIVEYTPEQQTQLASEWAKINSASMTAKFISDAVAMRDADRAACKGKK